MNSKLSIGIDLYFTPKSVSIAQSQKALKYFSDGYDSASNLEDKTPIFIDTNVLLDYYRISFLEREQLENFFKINKDRIYLTKQIENEFLKHRIDHIKSYLKSLEEFVNAYRNIKTEIDRLKSGEIKGFDQYINNNSILKNDYQDLRTELSEFNNSLKSKLKDIFQGSDFEQQTIEKEKKIDEIKKRLEEQGNIERKDPLLDITAQFKITDTLEEEERKFLKSAYDDLKKEYEPIKSDQNFNWKHTFPGCGEKNSKEDPYGDFIIYHEIVKFMKSTKQNAIFLTNDTEKNDWLLRNKAGLLPYTHYIINTYIATGHTLYIFAAKDKIRVSYQPIYAGEKNEINLQGSEEDFVGSSALLEPKAVETLEVVNLEEERESDFDGIFFDNYSDITKEELVWELYQSQKWAKTYGEDFVGTRSFIVKYLGSKKFNYKTSYNIKNKLIEEGLIEVYIHKATREIYSDVEAIKLTASGIALAEQVLNKTILQ